jgi:hypothetical protein
MFFQGNYIERRQSSKPWPAEACFSWTWQECDLFPKASAVVFYLKNDGSALRLE